MGDIYSTRNKHEDNIIMRHNKGIGIVNTIINIMKHISFSFYSFEISMILRNSLLINGILYNLETISNLKKQHIKLIEDCDNYLMMRIFNSPKTTPI